MHSRDISWPKIRYEAKGPDERRARKNAIVFSFFLFHEKYTKNPTLLLIKERRGAF